MFKYMHILYFSLQRRNVVVINASPLEYGHVLLIPDIDACRPQVSLSGFLHSFFHMFVSKGGAYLNTSTGERHAVIYYLCDQMSLHIATHSVLF